MYKVREPDMHQNGHAQLIINQREGVSRHHQTHAQWTFVKLAVKCFPTLIFVHYWLFNQVDKIIYVTSV